jgi:hypothetical protein
LFLLPSGWRQKEDAAHNESIGEGMECHTVQWERAVAEYIGFPVEIKVKAWNAVLLNGKEPSG